jgi:asparagine synthase (glutamine-hydrolysing)
VQYLDVKTYLVDDILTKVDRASMGHALEVRVPILDHEFMELVATIPSSLKLKGKQGKYIFKKALNNILSNDVLCRKKQGFSMPVSGWFKNELKPLFQDSVLSNTSLSRDMLSPKVVNKIWKQHQTGQRERGSELWAILMFEKWMRQWA